VALRCPGCRASFDIARLKEARAYERTFVGTHRFKCPGCGLDVEHPASIAVPIMAVIMLLLGSGSLLGGLQKGRIQGLVLGVGILAIGVIVLVSDLRVRGRYRALGSGK